MSVYSRFKRNPDGLRALVELWETTPSERRKKMIDVGMAEDAVYTEKALQYVIHFEDILALPEQELAELLSAMLPRLTALSVANLGEDVKQRFIKHAPFKLVAEIRDQWDVPALPTEISGARLKMVAKARELERSNRLNLKKIPVSS